MIKCGTHGDKALFQRSVNSKLAVLH